MARQAISAQRHLLRALSQWPKDPVRPQVQFQDVLRKRFEQTSTSSPALSEEDQLKQANALYSLLDNRYKKKYPITGSILKPKSNPTYYADLVQELEEGPQRSWLDRLLLRVGGLVRLQ
ncbi:hypothetical protein MGN70_010446 [Eutypa lata]|uniref:Uncharacterized protein n=1 Tax=Eutypa lata (strain UCR-EL1) TaxID=1287681 RepID=M7S736_EUTLA|nr:hypothetical protein UCREL1_11184 [Eutypa lata UCREL1]KAI1248197.1 hypothetical protein MGN70_010446 [Eutypa lata]